jgi:hypothetical protein
MPRWLKILIACALLAALVAGIDWDALPQHLSRVDWRLGAVALLVIAAELAVNASKWSWSLRLHDARFAWTYLFRTGCYAYFFNNFLPSAIGGDVYRIYRTMRDGERSRAVSAVLVERVVGLAVMLFNGLIGAMALAGAHELARWYLLLAGVGTAVGVVVLALLYFGAFDSLGRGLARTGARELAAHRAAASGVAAAGAVLVPVPAAGGWRRISRIRRHRRAGFRRGCPADHCGGRHRFRTAHLDQRHRRGRGVNCRHSGGVRCGLRLCRGGRDRRASAGIAGQCGMRIVVPHRAQLRAPVSRTQPMSVPARCANSPPIEKNSASHTQP